MNISQFKNVFYDAKKYQRICPTYSLSSIVLWKEYFLQYTRLSEVMAMEYSDKEYITQHYLVRAIDIKDQKYQEALKEIEKLKKKLALKNEKEA